jgi:hypothetical protein
VARPTRHVPRDSSRRRLWVYIAVLVFLAVDAILIGTALTANSTNADAGQTRPVPLFTPTPAGETSGTEAPSTPGAPATPTARTATVAITPVPPTRLLAAVDATTAWRATTGDCPAATAAPQLTTDSGATWKTTDATARTQVTALQSIQATSASTAEFVGLAQTGCAPQLVKTFVGGDNFSSYPDQFNGAWFVNPANRASVHTPSGAETAPCDVVIALAARDGQNAAVLCNNQTAFTTTDAATTWSHPVTVTGAVNLTVTEAGYSFAAVGLAQCAGVQLAAFTAETMTVTPTGCLPVVEPVETLVGNVALSESAGSFWLWAGDTVSRSSDGGVTWQ